MRGIKLRKRLKLTHTVAPKPGGSVPAFAHRLPNGTWELKPATFDRQGRMIIRTRTFSINLPSFLDPQTYTSAIGNFVAQKVGGRTSPVECPAPSPQWFTVSNLTVTAHACGQNNPATDGAERAELRIKNNRGAVQQVTLAGPRDFVYVEGQPDALRAAIGRITGTDPSNTVFLSPGDGGYMTVGYRRPASQGTYSTIVETTYQSLFLNYAYMAVSTFADIVGDDVKLVAAIRLAQECLGTYDLTHGTVKDPKTAISSTSFVEVFGCVLGNAAEELADPKKALAAAINLTEGHLPGYTTDQLTEQLTKVGGRLMDLGRIVRLFNILPVLQQNVQGAIDTFFALTSGGTSTHVDVDLASAATPPVDTPPDTARSIVVDNRVTNGASAMREDTPAYLSTRTTNFCKRDGCALPGTDFGSGTNLRAECTVIGNRTTNGQDNSAIDDANPGLYTSTRWYGIRWGDGRFGFLSEVWVAAAFRGGLNLPAC